jgi:hypothetical protein
VPLVKAPVLAAGQYAAVVDKDNDAVADGKEMVQYRGSRVSGMASRQALQAKLFMGSP